MKQNRVSSITAAAASNDLKTSASNDSKETAAASSMATIQDDDERLLAQIGYRQVPPLVLLPAQS